MKINKALELGNIVRVKGTEIKGTVIYYNTITREVQIIADRIAYNYKECEVELYMPEKESITIKQLQSKKLQLMGDIGVLLTKFSDDTGVEVESIHIDYVVREFEKSIPLRYFVDVGIKV